MKYFLCTIPISGYLLGYWNKKYTDKDFKTVDFIISLLAASFKVILALSLGFVKESSIRYCHE